MHLKCACGVIKYQVVLFCCGSSIDSDATLNYYCLCFNNGYDKIIMSQWSMRKEIETPRTIKRNMFQLLILLDNDNSLA